MAVLLASGGVYHGVETSKLLNYANTTCLIEQNSFQSYTCVRFYIRYACHAPFWVVHYKDYRAIVEGMTRYKSISTALTEANTYKSGSSYSCWYNTGDSSKVQWDKPNVRYATIILSCGGFAALLTIIFLYIMCLFIRQETRQFEQENVIDTHITFEK